MKTSEIISKLKKLDCCECERATECGGFCDAQGCQIINATIERLESLEKEREACFRLGQMDMQESVVDMLKNAADNTFGIARSTLREAARAVGERGADCG